MFLVPHTHWDREWYQPFQRFRMRLVDLVDGVLERAEADGRFCFTFDGQTAMLEDYLAIRPEAEPRIKALLAAGQLAVKPWRIRWIGASTGAALTPAPWNGGDHPNMPARGRSCRTYRPRSAASADPGQSVEPA